MANESARSYKFSLALKKAAGSDAVYHKYNDRSTSGIVDSSLTLNGRTLWLEFKNRGQLDTRPFAELLKSTNRHARAQIYNVWLLDTASNGRAFFVVLGRSGASLFRVVNPHKEIFEEVLTDSQANIVNRLITLCQ